MLEKSNLHTNSSLPLLLLLLAADGACAADLGLLTPLADTPEGPADGTDEADTVVGADVNFSGSGLSARDDSDSSASGLNRGLSSSCSSLNRGLASGDSGLNRGLSLPLLLPSESSLPSRSGPGDRRGLGVPGRAEPASLAAARWGRRSLPAAL